MNEKINESISDLLTARSILTLMVFATTCVLALNGKPIPPLLEIGCKGLFGVWFGEKMWAYIKNGNGGTK